MVCNDASKEGIGGVLVQGRSIAYASRKLKPHKENYVTNGLELMAIVYAHIFWKHYLVGIKFGWKIDHCGLQYIFTQSDLRAR